MADSCQKMSVSSKEEIKKEINSGAKNTEKFESFDSSTCENAKFQERDRLETEENENITIIPQDTNIVAENDSGDHFVGYKHDNYMNIYLKETKDENGSGSQENAGQGENKYVNTDISANNESKESPSVKECISRSGDLNNEKSKRYNSFRMLFKIIMSKLLSELLNIPVNDGQEVVKQSLEKSKNDCQEATDLKNTREFETKPFKTEENDENEDLMKILLSLRHFKIRTDVLVYTADSKWHPQAVNDIPWSWLNEGKWRLHTFSRYPHNANKSAILLAEAGFVYIGSGKGSDDKVICHFCCVVKQDWQTSDVITLVHKNLSPDCSLVTGINCKNVPMNMPENGQHLFVQLERSRDVYAHEEERHKTGHEIERDGIETDSSHAGEIVANQGLNNLSLPSTRDNRNIPPAHVARPFQMASQTVMRPIDSISPTSGEPTVTTFTLTQPSISDLSYSTMNSNRNSTNPPSPNTAVTSRGQTTGAQENVNNISSSRPAAAETSVQIATQNTQHLLAQTTASSAAVSPTATSTSQVSQVAASSIQNPAKSTASTNSTASTSSATAAAASTTSNVNQNTTPSQVQGNVSYTTNGEIQNNTRTAGRTPTYGELGIITERPKRYEFAVRAKRFESFEPWPRDHHLKKEDLADAGFYYAGYGDCARCFYCGGGLRNWEDDDNVWVEHARWFPKCAFMRQTMGQQFVDAVQELNKSNDQITFAMVTAKMGRSAASFQLDTKNMPLKRDPAVITVLGMGYTEKDVFEAANFVKESFGVLSADKLFEKLEQDEKQRTKEQIPADSQAVRSTSDLSKDEIVMNELKEQNNQLRQQTVCKICMDKEVAVVFLPCGHLVSCTDCAAALKDCPVCRNPVRGIVRAFMA